VFARQAASSTCFSSCGHSEASCRATTKQLDKHRNTPACASCHIHIDPPGFALENDAIGGWRDWYRASKPTKGGFIKGHRYHRDPDVEKGGQTPDGRSFKNIRRHESRPLFPDSWKMTTERCVSQTPVWTRHDRP